MMSFKLNQWNLRGWGTEETFHTKTSILDSIQPNNSFAITVLNELNKTPDNFNKRYPHSLITETGRGTGVAIINHHPSKIKLNLIETIPGRAIIADIITNLNHQQPTITRIVAIYAPAKLKQRKVFTSNLENTINKLDHNTNISIITGDLNCHHNSNDDLDNYIQQLCYLYDLIDMDPSNKPTYKATRNEITHQSRIDRMYINHNLINFDNVYIDTKYLTASDHHFITATIKLAATKPSKRKRWILRPIISNNLVVIEKVNKLLDHLIQFKCDFSTWLTTKKRIIKLLRSFERCISNNKRIQRENLVKLLEFEPFAKQAEASLAAIHHSNNIDKQHDRQFNHHIDSERPSRLRTLLLIKKSITNEITAINDEQGVTHTIQSKILESFQKYYAKLFAAQPDDHLIHQQLLDNIKVIQDHNWFGLDAPFTIQEVIDAIKGMHPNKSPGPDGITNQFYINHAKQLAPLLVAAYNDLMDNPEVIDPDFLLGYTITLFKSGNPLEIGNRRPITLLDTDLKIISKIINSRIVPIVKQVVNHNQKGFVPGRFIIDNIISMNEIIQYLNARGITGILTMYDFAKAFDSISHSSIERTLKHIGIPTKLIAMIMTLLKDSTAQILVNGVPTDSFYIRRGVKQGDPLSPTLFVLVVECLAAAINNDKRLTGLPMNDGPQREKFQLFADDSLSLAPNYKQQSIIIEYFQLFCKATSSKLNLDKSISIIIGNPKDIQHYPPAIQSATEAERYLGYFFTNKGIERRMPKILQSIKASLILWKSSGTTIKTKTTILNTYALSRLVYYSYIEEFTDDEIDQINKLITWFMSAPNNINNIGPTGINSTNLMAAKRSKHSMKEGGWGIWDISCRQKSQKIWIFNRFINEATKGKFETAYYKSWWYQLNNNNITSNFLFKILNLSKSYKYYKGTIPKPMLDKDGNILKLKDIYHQLLNLPKIPLTEYQQSLQLDGYTFNNLFTNILNTNDPKGRNTMFRFQARCLPINHLHNTNCPLCNIPMSNDPYGHLFIKCIHTRNYINIAELKELIYELTGKDKQWKYIPSKTTLKPRFFKNMVKDSAIHQLNRDSTSQFNWNYRDINFDLHRSDAYRNLICIVMHQIWIWLCKNIFSTNEVDTLIESQLNYELITKKWYKLIHLEYTKVTRNTKSEIIKGNIKNIRSVTSLPFNNLISKWFIPKNYLPTAPPPI
jgi:hypothetical protein